MDNSKTKNKFDQKNTSSLQYSESFEEYDFYKKDKLIVENAEMNDEDNQIIKELFTSVPQVWTETTNSTVPRLKTVMINIERFKQYFIRSGLKPYLGTINFDRTLPLKKAWEIVNEVSETVIFSLIESNSEYEIHYISSAIEHHPGGKDASKTKNENKGKKGKTKTKAKAEDKANAEVKIEPKPEPNEETKDRKFKKLNSSGKLETTKEKFSSFLKKEKENTMAELKKHEDDDEDVNDVKDITEYTGLKNLYDLHLKVTINETRAKNKHQLYDEECTLPKEQIDPDKYNEQAMTLDLNTFLSNFMYTTSKSRNNDNDFYKYIEAMQDRTSDLILSGKVYPFQRFYKKARTIKIKDEDVNIPESFYYVKTFEFMIVKSILLGKVKISIIGWPHLHFCLLIKSTTNPDLVEHDLEESVRETLEGVAHDIKFDRRNLQQKKDKDVVHHKVYDQSSSPTNAFSYILKNSTNCIVKKMLEKYSDFYQTNHTHFIKSYINIDKPHSDIIASLLITISDFQHKKTQKLSILKSYERNMIVPQSVFLYRKFQEKESFTVPIDDIYLADPEIEKGRFLFERSIQDNMSELNLACYKGHLFKRIEHSKSSWNYYSSIVDYLNSTINNIKFKVNKTLIERVTLMMTNDNENVVKLSNSGLITFRQIKINYRMVEFKDGYLSLETGKIYKIQEKYHTYLFFPDVSIENIHKTLEEYLTNGETLKYFKRNSDFFRTRTFNLFALTLIKRISGEARKNVLIMMGPPGSGKSTISDILESIFPPHEVGKPTEINDFEFFYHYKGKEFISMTEASSAMSNHSINREDTLILLEGRDISVNEKHGSKGKAKSDFGIIMTSNCMNKTLNFIEDSAIADRANYLHTGCREEGGLLKSILLSDTIKEELPSILLLMTMCRISYENQLDFVPNLQVEEKLEGLDLVVIDRCFNIGKSKISSAFSTSKMLKKYKQKTTEIGYTNVNISPHLLPSIYKTLTRDRLEIIREIKNKIDEKNAERKEW